MAQQGVDHTQSITMAQLGPDTARTPASAIPHQDKSFSNNLQVAERQRSESGEEKTTEANSGRDSSCDQNLSIADCSSSSSDGSCESNSSVGHRAGHHKQTEGVLVGGSADSLSHLEPVNLDTEGNSACIGSSSDGSGKSDSSVGHSAGHHKQTEGVLAGGSADSLSHLEPVNLGSNSYVGHSSGHYKQTEGVLAGGSADSLSHLEPVNLDSNSSVGHSAGHYKQREGVLAGGSADSLSHLEPVNLDTEGSSAGTVAYPRQVLLADGEPSDSERSHRTCRASSFDNVVPATEPTVVSFVDARTLHKASPKSLHYPRVLQNLVKHSPDGGTLEELLAELQKDHSASRSRELSRQLHHRQTAMTDNRQFGDLALCLKITKHHAATTSCLLKLLLQLGCSQDAALAEQVRQVAAASRDALLQLTDDSPCLLPMTALYLMAMSALLSRCPHPDPSSLHALGLSQKELKKKHQQGEGLKCLALKALQTFHEGVGEVLDKNVCCLDWDQAGFSQEDRAKRNLGFARASLCQLFVCVFTLLSELNLSGRTKRGRSLIGALQDVFDSWCSRSGKAKLGEEARVVLDFALVQGVVQLLKHTFEEEDPNVGDQCCDHSKQLAIMSLRVIRSTVPVLKDHLCQVVQPLHFHKSRQVKTCFNELFSCFPNLSVFELAQGYMAENLALVDFKRHKDSISSVSGRCGWQPITCTVNKEEAEGYLYTPHPDCLSNLQQLAMCMKQHPGIKDKTRCLRTEEDSLRHMRNQDLLMELSPKCRHIVQLHAYQILPFPFYITEQVEERRLLMHLIDHRHNEMWLDSSVLKLVILQLLEVLIFLAARHLDPRDVTPYNTIVVGQSGSQRGSSCSVLTSPGGFMVKLADLGLTHEYRSPSPTNNDAQLRPVYSHGPVPVRFVSPEALLKGHYGEKNMIYSVGTFAYQLWTHGCEPFTSYDDLGNTTDEILTKALTSPGSVTLETRPCIPDSVHAVIRHCTEHDPARRPATLVEVRDAFNHVDLSEDTTEARLQTAMEPIQRYPLLSKRQEDRRHIPETEIPQAIQNLIDSDKKSKLYDLARRQTMYKKSSSSAVTSGELTAMDSISFNRQDDIMIVEEMMTRTFVSDELPSLEAGQIKGVTCWQRSEEQEPPVPRSVQHMFIHTRVYPAAVTLHEAAQKGLLREVETSATDIYDEPNSELAFLVPFTSLVRTVADLHEHRWVIRDLTERTVLVSFAQGRVTLPRIGRMRHLPPNHTFVVDEVFDDIRRWCPPEVLLSGQYSQKSDMFSLGTLFKQFFKTEEIVTRRSTFSDLDLVPCARIEKSQLVNYIRDVTSRCKEKPPGRCPQWLYDDIIKHCLHPDPTLRPTARQVLQVLEQRWDSGQDICEPFIHILARDEAEGPLQTHQDTEHVSRPQKPQHTEHTVTKQLSRSQKILRSVRRMGRLKSATAKRVQTHKADSIADSRGGLFTSAYYYPDSEQTILKVVDSLSIRSRRCGSPGALADNTQLKRVNISPTSMPANSTARSQSSKLPLVASRRPVEFPSEIHDRTRVACSTADGEILSPGGWAEFSLKPSPSLQISPTRSGRPTDERSRHKFGSQGLTSSQHQAYSDSKSRALSFGTVNETKKKSSIVQQKNGASQHLTRIDESEEGCSGSKSCLEDRNTRPKTIAPYDQLKNGLHTKGGRVWLSQDLSPVTTYDSHPSSETVCTVRIERNQPVGIYKNQPVKTDNLAPSPDCSDASTSMDDHQPSVIRRKNSNRKRTRNRRKAQRIDADITSGMKYSQALHKNDLAPAFDRHECPKNPRSALVLENTSLNTNSCQGDHASLSKGGPATKDLHSTDSSSGVEAGTDTDLDSDGQSPGEHSAMYSHLETPDSAAVLVYSSLGVADVGSDSVLQSRMARTSNGSLKKAARNSPPDKANCLNFEVSSNSSNDISTLREFKSAVSCQHSLVQHQEEYRDALSYPPINTAAIGKDDLEDLPCLGQCSRSRDDYQYSVRTEQEKEGNHSERLNNCKNFTEQFNPTLGLNFTYISSIEGGLIGNEMPHTSSAQVCPTRQTGRNIQSDNTKRRSRQGSTGEANHSENTEELVSPRRANVGAAAANREKPLPQVLPHAPANTGGSRSSRQQISDTVIPRSTSPLIVVKASSEDSDSCSENYDEPDNSCDGFDDTYFQPV